MSACILVVDDNSDILRLVERVLTGQGYEVLAFESPLEALDAVKEDFIDLAILDIDMPGMDALRLAAEIRKANIPFIFLSACVDCECVSKTKIAGALELLVKPVRQEQLIISVANALALSRSSVDKNIFDLRLQRIINIAVGLRSNEKGLTVSESYQSIRDEARSSSRKIFDVAMDIVDGHDHVVRLMHGDPSLLKK